MILTKYLVLTENLEVLGTMSGRDSKDALLYAQKAYGMENLLLTKDGADEYIAKVMQVAIMQVQDSTGK